MTETIPDFSAPAEAPAPVQEPSQRGRPSRVVQRDLAVARTLAEEERSLHAIMAALDLPWRVTYNSVCRLRERGLVDLNRNGTRTPTWFVTERGREWLGTPEPPAEAALELPSSPDPAPTAEVPAPPPEPVTVPPAPGPTEPVWPV